MIERIKNTAEKVKASAKNVLTRGKFAIGATTATAGAAALAVVASAEDSVGSSTFTVPSIASSITGDMMNGIFTQMTDLLPVVLPVLVGCLAFRKGLSFFISLVRGL